jgi:effector-binding domain-containing protein
MGFDGAQPGAHAVIGEDGNLTWVVPEVTVEELAAELGDPANAEAGTEATGIYAKLDAKADAADVEAVNAKIGDVAEGKTLIEMITEATYNDTKVKADIATNTEAIAVLNGNGDGSVIKTVNDAINKFATDVSADDVVNSYKELIDYAAENGAEMATLVGKVNKIEEGAQVNFIKSVDETQFDVDETGKLTLLDIVIGKVTGLQDALDGKADNGTTLAEYGILDAYTKEETLNKITEKIAEVNGGESAGEVLGQLNSYKETNNARVDTIEGKLTTIEEAAQVNKIEAIKVGDTSLAIADKTVTIPVGAGLKASDEVLVAEDGTMSLGVISWDKIAQGDDELIFDGGGASA